MSRMNGFIKKIFPSKSFKEKGKSINKNILTFCVFLILSASLWFVNSFRKTYISEVSYPVFFINPPNGLVVNGGSLQNLSVTIKADGFILAGYNFSRNFQPLEIDLSTYKSHFRRTEKGLFILSNSLTRRLGEVMSKNVQIVSIGPDTLFVDFSICGSKKVAVELQKTFSFEKQYNQSASTIITPDSVIISGSQMALDAVTCVYTEMQTVANIKDSLFLTCKLKTDSRLTLNQDVCTVVVPVEPFTESKIKIPVIAKNLSETLNAKFFPSEITLSYNVAISKLKSIIPNQFSAETDFSLISSTFQPDKMKVKIVKQPDFVNNVSYSPLLVDYILETKK